MPIDPLTLAGDAAAVLERHGFVACGRRESGRTRVDFWTRDGASYRHELKGNELTVEEVVAACISLAEPPVMVKTTRSRWDVS